MNAIGRRPVPIRSGIARSVFCCGCCTTSGGKSQLGMIIMSAVFMVICIAMYVNMGYFSRYNCESKIALAQQTITTLKTEMTQITTENEKLTLETTAANSEVTRLANQIKALTDERDNLLKHQPPTAPLNPGNNPLSNFIPGMDPSGKNMMNNLPPLPKDFKLPEGVQLPPFLQEQLAKQLQQQQQQQQQGDINNQENEWPGSIKDQGKGFAPSLDEEKEHNRRYLNPSTVKRAPLAPYPLTSSQTDYYRRINRGNVAPSEGQPEPAPTNPRNARALLIICFNRPDYLRRTLQAVYDRLPSFNRPHIYVSQDGDVQTVTRVINEFANKFASDHADIPFNHWNHPNGPLSLRGDTIANWATGYYKLSQHFGWALNKLFNEIKHPRVIILEDDLEISVDFFDFFSAMEPHLDTDDSLLAVSAWSDLGQNSITADPRQVHRSDFFPGLGWMITRHVWEDIGPKWPEAFWDDWLREPPQRKARQFLRPEVSRSYTFGESGVSQSQFFREYLGSIKLNDVPVDWTSEDTSYLDQGQWDSDMTQVLGNAKRIHDLQSFVTFTCNPTLAYDSVSHHVDRKDTVPSDDFTGTDIQFIYGGTNEYPAAARAFHYIDDIKAGVPRTAYKGVVTIKHNGCRKFLVPGVALDENNALPH